MLPNDPRTKNYDHIRCITCGEPWEDYTEVDPATGKIRIIRGHTTDQTVAICARHCPDALAARPPVPPEAIDDAAKARGELVGTKTAEWLRDRIVDWFRVMREKGGGSTANGERGNHAGQAGE